MAAPGAAVEAVEGECDWEGLDDRCEAWTTDGAVGGQLAISPTGDRIFTWGGDIIFGGDSMVAHDAATGEKLWATTFPGIGSSSAKVRGLSVSPDGSRVYAVGDDVVVDALHLEDRDVIVAAFAAATGEELWRTTLGRPAIVGSDRFVSREEGFAVAASPDGERVYVTGDTRLFDRIKGWYTTNHDVLAAGYDAATGQEQWRTTWGERFLQYHGTHLVVSPNSRHLYIAGRGRQPCGLVDPIFCPPDFMTLKVRAYAPAAPDLEGRVAWDAFYDGFGGPNEVLSFELAPDGSRVYLTGASAGVAWAPGLGDFDWATVAYDTTTGEQLWVKRYQGPDDDLPVPGGRKFPDGNHGGLSISNAQLPEPPEMTVGPDGAMVFVTGTFEAHAVTDTRAASSELPASRIRHAATLAYDAATGEELWAAYSPTLTSAAAPVLGDGYASPNTENVSVAVSPDGTTVYALGQASGTGPADVGQIFGGSDRGQTTVAYDAATGDQRWVARLPGHQGVRAAIHPDGASVYTLSLGGAMQAYHGSGQ